MISKIPLFQVLSFSYSSFVEQPSQCHGKDISVESLKSFATTLNVMPTIIGAMLVTVQQHTVLHLYIVCVYVLLLFIRLLVYKYVNIDRYISIYIYIYTYIYIFM